MKLGNRLREVFRDLQITRNDFLNLKLHELNNVQDLNGKKLPILLVGKLRMIWKSLKKEDTSIQKQLKRTLCNPLKNKSRRKDTIKKCKDFIKKRCKVKTTERFNSTRGR